MRRCSARNCFRGIVAPSSSATNAESLHRLLELAFFLPTAFRLDERLFFLLLQQLRLDVRLHQGKHADRELELPALDAVRRAILETLGAVDGDGDERQGSHVVLESSARHHRSTNHPLRRRPGPVVESRLVVVQPSLGILLVLGRRRPVSSPRVRTGTRPRTRRGVRPQTPIPSPTRLGFVGGELLRRRAGERRAILARRRASHTRGSSSADGAADSAAAEPFPSLERDGTVIPSAVSRASVRVALRGFVDSRELRVLGDRRDALLARLPYESSESKSLSSVPFSRYTLTLCVRPSVSRLTMLPAFSTLTTRLERPLERSRCGCSQPRTRQGERPLHHPHPFAFPAVLLRAHFRQRLGHPVARGSERRRDATGRLAQETLAPFPRVFHRAVLHRRETHRVRIANVVRARLRVIRETSLRFRRVHTLRLELAPLLRRERLRFERQA